jgi:hypothetical protein
MDKKSIEIFAGGTRFYIAPHLALSAPAEGQSGLDLDRICRKVFGDSMDIKLHLTRQGLQGYRKHTVGCTQLESLDTNADVSAAVDKLLANDRTKIIFFPISMVDHVGTILPTTAFESSGDGSRDNPIHSERLTSSFNYKMMLSPSDKVISKIREKRKDIFLCGFKQTHNLTEDEQYLAGLNLCKKSSCNLVLANDTGTGLNMVICPEEARYHVTKDRQEALTGLVEMAKLRSHLTFTRSTVIAGEPVPWDSDLIPATLRKVVDHCIEANAYKPFNGVTTGHFACKIDEQTFLTSQRRTNFNDLSKIGLVKIKTDGPDTVLAYGSKPSVGGQSQRIIFEDHTEMNCVVHFHVEKRADSKVPVVSQYEHECGSHECGAATSNGLKQFGSLKAVMLDNHGPNIVFNQSIDPQEVIDFIDSNFDLSSKTGGFVSTLQATCLLIGYPRKTITEDVVF